MINYRQLKRELISFFQNHILILFFILFFFIMGLIFGSLAVKFLDYQQKKELIDYLSQSITEINQLLAEQHKLMAKRIIIANLKSVFILWGLTLTGLGIIIIPGIIFLRGFILGFTVGFLVDELFFKGLGLALAAVLPHNLLIIPGLILGAVFSLVFVYKLGITLLTENRNYKQQLGQGVLNYSAVMGGIAFLLLLAGLIEAYFTPQLVKLVTHFLIN